MYNINTYVVIVYARYLIGLSINADKFINSLAEFGE